MPGEDFTTSFEVDASPVDVFNAVVNPRAWWSAGIEGETDRLGAEWTYRFGDNHRSTMRVQELDPGRRVVWLVVDNFFAFTKDKTEWIGNRITFDISVDGGGTKLTFTQVGLVPAYECYVACRDAWTGFIHKSLKHLIETGRGRLNWYEQ